MTSKKRSAKAKQIAAFRAQLVDAEGRCKTNEAFSREEKFRTSRNAVKETAKQRKACASKNRYLSRADAEEAIELCSFHGTAGLSCYHCDYCNGWHLTSHPWDA